MFGDICIVEPVFKLSGKRFRPFSQSAGVVCRGCSLPLQKALTDFAADHAFGQVSDKPHEHYGVTLPASTIRRIAECRAQEIYEMKSLKEDVRKTPDREYVIAEVDGSMIPIVEPNKDARDKRKQKNLSWKEVKLCLARPSGSVTPYFGYVFQGTTDDAGKELFNCAVNAGFGPKTYLHAVGDGAPWIADQVEQQFGAQGRYLADFYHVCEYLGAAAKYCAADDDEKTWLSRQKEALKQGRPIEVINGLKPFAEPPEKDGKNAPVRACERYLSNRLQQLDYPAALKNGLPIGSGEIESAHRYVVQERLKLPGAWWTTDNADYMLALRVMRANRKWDGYWDALAA